MPEPQYRYNVEQRAEWLKALHEAAADRPAHARYLSELVDHYAAGGEGDDEPKAGDGVSWRIEVALSSDVEEIFAEPLPEGRHGSGYGREYVKLRQRARTAAALGRATRAQRAKADESLEGLLDLSPGQPTDPVNEKGV
jgi:hypothetical protein